MNDSARREKQPDRAAASLAGLEDKVERATKLIEELRESNYQLTDQLAQLKRELESAEKRAEKAVAGSAGQGSSDAVDAEEASDAASMRLELKKLRRERQAVRKKVEVLLDRLEQLET